MISWFSMKIYFVWILVSVVMIAFDTHILEASSTGPNQEIAPMEVLREPTEDIRSEALIVSFPYVGISKVTGDGSTYWNLGFSVQSWIYRSVYSPNILIGTHIAYHRWHPNGDEIIAKAKSYPLFSDSGLSGHSSILEVMPSARILDPLVEGVNLFGQLGIGLSFLNRDASARVYHIKSPYSPPYPTGGYSETHITYTGKGGTYVTYTDKGSTYGTYTIDRTLSFYEGYVVPEEEFVGKEVFVGKSGETNLGLSLGSGLIIGKRGSIQLEILLLYNIVFTKAETARHFSMNIGVTLP